MKRISLLFIISLFINGVVTDETVMVNTGYSVTLYTNIIIQSNDVIEWRYKDELIAKLDRSSISYFNGSDERLKINNQTGDLTIIDVTSEITGLYHLQITGEKTTRQTFNVSGQGGFPDGVTSLSVMEGEFVRLISGTPDFMNYDVMRWRFNNSPLAEINRNTHGKFLKHDERFRDRLGLIYWSGDLFITNMKTDLSGPYEVNINSNSGTHTIHQTYTITVSDEVKSVSVMEGDSVTLHTNITDIQKDDRIYWIFGLQEIFIARLFKYTDVEITYVEDVFGVSFKDRLKMDDKTGFLTITNIRTEHAGRYKLYINRKQLKQSISRTFNVTVSDTN